MGEAHRAATPEAPLTAGNGVSQSAAGHPEPTPLKNRAAETSPEAAADVTEISSPHELGLTRRTLLHSAHKG